MSGNDPVVMAGSATLGVQGIEIRVLGPVEVMCAGRPVDIGGVKARALVARLLVDRGIVVSGDALADSLWGEHEGNQGHIALRSTVSRLRKRVRTAGGPEDLIVTRAPGYLLNVPAAATDAHRFERLVSEGRQALRTRRPSETVRLLTLAESLWRGPAYREVCDEPFARAEARRLDELRLSATEARIDAELSMGRHESLVGELESLTGTHPLRERLWSQRMLALYRAGRQAEALRVFQELRSMLVMELGIEPGHDVAWMEHAILAHDPALDFPVLPEGQRSQRTASAADTDRATASRFRALGLQYDTPFVGRERESAQLRAWWESLQTSWRALIVDGDAGVGKTRLVAELASALEDEGVVVLWGGCDEDPVVPFQPLAESLGRYFDSQSADRISAMPEWQLSELSRLVPRLRDLAPPFEEEGDPESERYRFFEAVTETLKDLASRARILLVVDDAHRIDPPTILLLRHVLRGAAGPGFGFVGIFVDTELHAGDPLWSRVSDARVLNRAETVHLKGLDASGVEELTKSWTSASVDLVPQFRELTDGNPLFLQELLRQFHDRSEAPEAPEAPGDLPLSVDLTPTEAIRELVARRVSRLPEDVIYLLSAAAVAGREFEATVVAEAADLTAGQMLDAFDQAEESRLLRRSGSGTGDRYVFTHALVRDAIYDELLRGRRARYHNKIAIAIERAHGGDLDEFVNELAYHYYAGAALADADKALDFCAAAGERALRLLAFEEAVLHFTRRLEVAERFGPSDPATCCDALLALAEAESRAGDRDGAEEHLVRAAEVARSVGDGERLALAALRVGQPSNFGRNSPNATDCALLEEALAFLPPQDSALRAMATSRLGQVLVPAPGTSDQEAARLSLAVNTEAVGMARRLPDRRVLGHVLGARMQSLWGPGAARERLATSIEVGEIGEEVGDERLRLQGHLWLVRELLVVGDVGEVKRELNRQRAMLDGPVDPFEVAIAQNIDAQMAVLAGDIESAERLAELALGSLRALGGFAEEVFGTLMWWTWWQQGTLASPEHRFRHIVMRSEASDPSKLAVLAHLHAEAQESDQALEHLQSLEDLGWPDPRADLIEGIVPAVASAAACSVRGAPPGLLLRLYECLSPFAGTVIMVRGPSFGCAGPADQYLGLLARQSGDLALAEVHFEASLRLARHMGAAPFAAAAEVELARTLRQRRPDEEATRIAVMLRNVEESALAMGLHRLARLAAEPG